MDRSTYTSSKNRIKTRLAALLGVISLVTLTACSADEAANQAADASKPPAESMEPTASAPDMSPDAPTYQAPSIQPTDPASSDPAGIPDGDTGPAPACDTNSIDITFEWDRAGAGMSQRRGQFTITTTGGEECKLQGAPEITFLDNSGAQFKTASVDDRGQQPAVTLTSDSPIYVELRTSAAGAHGPQCDTAQATAAQITLPKQRDPIDVPFKYEFCTEANHTVTISPFMSEPTF